MVECACPRDSEVGVETKRIPAACWAASVAYKAKFQAHEKPCFKQNVEGTQGMTLELSSETIHMYIHVHGHTHA